MRSALRALKWAIIAVALAVLLLLLPIAYTETMCRGQGPAQPYQPILSAQHHRAETSTVMTFPEWHIVHAYEDYAEVIRRGDPHNFAFLDSIAEFWGSLCSLSQRAAEMGPIEPATKQMIYVIGVSFTAEMALKASYEESIGRLAARLRGNHRAASDDLSAAQAAAYATFLTQVPWYKWDFTTDAATLQALAPAGWRDRERQFALGLEYGAKAAYARVIAGAVAATGYDELTLQMVVNPNGSALPLGTDVRQIANLPEGVVLQTPRYRALTLILDDMAKSGADFVEIAGNDDIMFSVTSPSPSLDGAVYSAARQGFGDYRHLMVVKVPMLAAALRALGQRDAVLEHIHDY